MKKNVSTSPVVLDDDMRPEYTFDYRTARRNPYAARIAEEGYVVVVDPPTSEALADQETVPAVLRAVTANKPRSSARKNSGKKTTG
jgi:hypothetical protein